MATSSNATLLSTPSLVSHKSRVLRASSGRLPSLSFVASVATATAPAANSALDADARRLTINGNATEGTRTQLPPVASMWRRIQGTDDWKDLLEPLSPVLRQEIVRYGDFVLACYKAFDLDAASKRYLNCKYGRARMLHEVGMADSGYEVTKYIYAAPDIDMIPRESSARCSRWIGYVAVSSDEAAAGRLGRRDILVAFRGTVTTGEWIANLTSSLNPARLDPQNPRPDVKVQSGFLGLYTSDDSTCRFGSGSCREQLLSEVTRIIREHSGEELSITLAGHSMGSSLALLLGYDLAELGLNRDACGQEIPITVYSFGGPRVGNMGFKERCEELGVKVLRVVNVHDPVTKMPGVFLNDNFRVLAGRFEVPWSCSCYAHVGIELAVDFSKGKGPAEVHDLDAYVGLLKCYDSRNNLAAIKNNIKGSGNLLLSRLARFFVHACRWRDAVTRNVRRDRSLIGATTKISSEQGQIN